MNKKREREYYRKMEIVTLNKKTLMDEQQKKSFY